MNLLTLTPEEFCKATAACAEGREFALTHATMADVWDNCPRPDWLWWIARRVARIAVSADTLSASAAARRAQADQFRRVVPNPFPR